MKNLILLAFIILGCGDQAQTRDTRISKEHALNLKNKLIAKQDKYGLFEQGENAFYRQGWFIVALHKHGILTNTDVDNFVIALQSATGRCIKRRPDIDRCISKDDAVLIALALWYGQRYSGRATIYLKHWFFKDKRYMRLDQNMIYAPHYHDFFDRIKYIKKKAFLRDYALRATAQFTCTKPANDTSDKILLSAMLMISQEWNKSYLSKEAYNFCHNRVNYDHALEVYFRGHELQYLLKGLL